MKTKSIIIALAITFGLFATACSNDSNNNGTDSTIPLAGKWNITKVGTLVAGQEVLTDPPQNESGCNKDYLELKADNTATLGNYDSSTTPCALTTQSGTFTKMNNVLTTVIDGNTLNETILNLTLTELKLKDADTGVITVYVKG